MPERLPTLETVRIAEPVGYGAMLEEQHRRRKAVAEGTAPNTLYMLEHKPVITLGRDADQAHIVASTAQLQAGGVEVVDTDRGGDVTYHGPGQLVGYPILNLHRWRLSVGWYLRTLEQVLIDLLAAYGLQGERVKGLTGVWVNGAKVAAIGIGVRDWVTFHGFALNVQPVMEHFGFIVPCGIADKPVTSLEALLGEAPALDETATRFEHHFREHFLAPSPSPTE